MTLPITFIQRERDAGLEFYPFGRVGQRGLDTVITSGLSSAVYGTDFATSLWAGVVSAFVDLASMDIQNNIGANFAAGSAGSWASHLALGCVKASISGADCSAGMVGAATEQLFVAGLSGPRPAEGTDEYKAWKEEHSRNLALTSAFAGYVFSGGKGENVTAASSYAVSAFENNYLTRANLHEAISRLESCTESAEICRARALKFLAERSAENDRKLIEACGVDIDCMISVLGAGDPASRNGFASKADVLRVLGGVDPDLADKVVAYRLEHIAPVVVDALRAIPDFDEYVSKYGADDQPIAVWEALIRNSDIEQAKVIALLRESPVGDLVLSIKMCQDGSDPFCEGLNDISRGAQAERLRKISGRLDDLRAGKAAKVEDGTVRVDPSKATRGTPEYEMLNNPPANTRVELSNGTTFRTGKGGYVEEITYKPVDSPGARDARQTAVGKEGIAGDVGGHIQACRHGGTCDRFNLFPQNSNFNNSAYKTWENEITRSLQNGDDVGNVTVRLKRVDPYNPRPDSLTIEYEINGVPFERKFDNQAGQ